MKSYLKKLLKFVACAVLFAGSIQAMDRTALNKQFQNSLELFIDFVQKNDVNKAQTWLKRSWRRLEDHQKNQVVQIVQKSEKSHETLNQTIQELIKEQDAKNQDASKNKEKRDTQVEALTNQSDNSSDSSKEQRNSDKAGISALNAPEPQSNQQKKRKKRDSDDFQNSSDSEQLHNQSTYAQEFAAVNKAIEKNNMVELSNVWMNQVIMQKLPDAVKNVLLNMIYSPERFKQIQNLAVNGSSNALYLRGYLESFLYARFIEDLHGAKNGQQIIALWQTKMQRLHTGNYDNDILNEIRTHDNGGLLELLQQTEGQVARELLRRVQSQQNNLHNQPVVLQELLNNNPGNNPEELLNRMRAALIAGADAVIQLWNHSFTQVDEGLQVQALQIIAENQNLVNEVRQQAQAENNYRARILQGSLERILPVNDGQRHRQPAVIQQQPNVQNPQPQQVPVPNVPNAQNNQVNIPQWSMPSWAPIVLCVGVVACIGWLWNKYMKRDKKETENKNNQPQNNASRSTRRRA